MAIPSVPSVGTRAVYFNAVPAPAPSPTANLIGVSVAPGAFGTPNQPAPVDLPGNTIVGQPAIVLHPGNGPSPDFAGTVLLVFDQNGNANVRGPGLVSTTTWAANGNSPQQARWQMIDALS